MFSSLSSTAEFLSRVHFPWQTHWADQGYNFVFHFRVSHSPFSWKAPPDHSRTFWPLTLTIFANERGMRRKETCRLECLHWRCLRMAILKRPWRCCWLWLQSRFLFSRQNGWVMLISTMNSMITMNNNYDHCNGDTPKNDDQKLRENGSRSITLMTGSRRHR